MVRFIVKEFFLDLYLCLCKLYIHAKVMPKVMPKIEPSPSDTDTVKNAKKKTKHVEDRADDLGDELKGLGPDLEYLMADTVPETAGNDTPEGLAASLAPPPSRIARASASTSRSPKFNNYSYWTRLIC